MANDWRKMVKYVFIQSILFIENKLKRWSLLTPEIRSMVISDSYFGVVRDLPVVFPFRIFVLSGSGSKTFRFFSDFIILFSFFCWWILIISWFKFISLILENLHTEWNHRILSIFRWSLVAWALYHWLLNEILHCLHFLVFPNWNKMNQWLNE